MNSFDLSGRRALITGSSRGIGLALARALASAGAEVVLNGRRAQSLDAAAGLLRAEGARAQIAAFDVSDSAAVARGIERIESELGAIDILVNNAGTTVRLPLEQFTDQGWREIMRANLDSAFYVARAVAPRMIARRRGKIVNICSVLSSFGRAGTAPYAASKGALKVLTQGMCADWARYGLQINALGPGYIATDLTRPLQDDPDFTAWLLARTPAGRWGRTEDLAGPIVFLCSSAADFVNGQILYADGGLTSVL